MSVTFGDLVYNAGSVGIAVVEAEMERSDSDNIRLYILVSKTGIFAPRAFVSIRCAWDWVMDQL